MGASLRLVFTLKRDQDLLFSKTPCCDKGSAQDSYEPLGHKRLSNWPKMTTIMLKSQQDICAIHLIQIHDRFWQDRMEYCYQQSTSPCCDGLKNSTAY